MADKDQFLNTVQRPLPRRDPRSFSSTSSGSFSDFSSTPTSISLNRPNSKKISDAINYKERILQNPDYFSNPSSTGGKAKPPVIAKSLSSITDLANNPPLKFTRPVDHGSSNRRRRSWDEEREKSYGLSNSLSRVQPALTLYFVRVPGRKNGDFIITVREPLKGTVTGEDVRGCLYYVCVHDGGSSMPGEDAGHNDERIPIPEMPVRRPSFFHRRSWKRSGDKSGGEFSTGHMRSRSYNGQARDKSREFGMTIVRRDTASGDQWNVAEVCSGVSLGFGSDDRHPPILIALPREGYTKFLSPVLVKKELVPGASLSLPPVPTPPAMSGNPGSRGELEEYFLRKREYDVAVAEHQRVVKEEMERLEEQQRREFEERALIREIIYDPGDGHRWKKIFKRKSRHWRTNSTAEEGTGDGDGREGRDTETRKKGYIFDGLWGADGYGRSQTPPSATSSHAKAGKCAFKEMAGGKILKCKYYPPNYSGLATSSPDSISSQQLMSSSSPSILLSAMEFKLPSTSTKIYQPSNLEGIECSSSTAKERMKLATFVVHPLGIDMLDMLVAANVGMFWRKWEEWARERGATGL